MPRGGCPSILDFDGTARFLDFHFFRVDLGFFFFFLIFGVYMFRYILVRIEDEDWKNRVFCLIWIFD